MTSGAQRRSAASVEYECMLLLPQDQRGNGDQELLAVWEIPLFRPITQQLHLAVRTNHAV
jgi:hypothetical protein